VGYTVKRFVVDIEADNLLDTCKKIWCVVFYDIDEDKHHVFYPYNVHDEDPNALANFIYTECPGATIIGHNILGYDLPVIRKLEHIEYSVGKQDTWNSSNVEFVDTWQLSSFLWPDRPGGHSLDNLAKLAGSHKQDYKGGFEEYSDEMLEYCKWDCVATAKVYEYLLKEAKEKYGD
jgi:DNA polymerase III epsilon subunit-like protein